MSMRPPAELQKQRMIRGFFLGVFLLLLWQTLRLLSVFFGAILGALLVTLLVYPLHARLARRLRRPQLSALLTTGLVVLLFVLPLVGLGWVSVKESARLYPAAQQWLGQVRDLRADPLPESLPPALSRLLEEGTRWLDAKELDPRELALRNLDELSRRTTAAAGKIIRNVLFVLFNLGVMVLTVFFFLRDGPMMVERGVELLPLAPEHKLTLLTRVSVTMYAVIRGVLLVAAVQGALAGIGFYLFGVPFPALLGLLTIVLAPIPLIGTAAVWVPVAGGLLLSGAAATALKVTLWSVLVVGMVDNVLRPVLIGAEAKLPMLPLFFGMLGGLKLYGAAGLFIGPIVMALLLTFIDIYRREYRWLLGPEEP